MSVLSTDSEAEKTGADAEHAEDLRQRIGFAKEDQTVGKTDDGTSATDRTDHRNE